MKDSSVLSALRAIGVKIFVGHSVENIDGSQVIVRSSAIGESNPEIVHAREIELPILTRAQALSILMSESKSIAVAGTHGKTTTTSMLTVALQAAGERSILCNWWSSYRFWFKCSQGIGKFIRC